MKCDDEEYVMADMYTTNYSLNEIHNLQLQIDKSLKDQNLNNQNRLTLGITQNMVQNIQRVTRNLKIVSRPLLLIGNSGTGRKSVLKLAVHIYKKFKLLNLTATDDLNTLSKELSNAIIQAIKGHIILEIDDHSRLANEKLHWV